MQTAITETAPHVRELADAYPEFREIGKRMLTEWEQGALDSTPTVTTKSRGGDAQAIRRSLRCRQTAQGQKEGRLPQSRRAAFSQVSMNGGACSAV
jgi:hypothetical protein